MNNEHQHQALEAGPTEAADADHAAYVHGQGAQR